jgi:carboxyl-terminal processing protease
MNPFGGRQNNSVQFAQPARGGVGWPTYIITILVVALCAFAVGTRFQDLFVGQNNWDYAGLGIVYTVLKANYDGSLDSSKLLDGAKAGLVQAVGDPYTEYFTANEAKAFSDDLDGNFTGIGIEMTSDNNQTKILSVIADSPAYNAGMKAGDVIATVNGTDVSTWTSDKIATAIQGDAGTTVKVGIIRDSSAKEFTLTRAALTDPSVKMEIKDGIGYLQISRFADTDTASLAQKYAQQMKDQKVKGVILDLRDNGGGSVDAAKAVASLWLPSGTTITTEKQSTTGKVLDTVTASGNAILQGVPTEVLIDSSTASASEIVSGALRDNGAAKLVGQKSYGKGVVQQLINLDGGAELKVTVAKWYTPKGANINHNGLTPDYKVEMTADQYNSGNDTQRAKATELLNQK